MSSSCVGLSRTAVLVAFILCLPVPALAEPLLLVPFQTTETGQMRDPTGLWSPAEVAEGGSDVQPSVWYAHFPVRGGAVMLAVLVDAWCGMSECPVRFRVEATDGRVVQNFETVDYDMVCQAFESFTYDPEARVLHACAARIALLPEG